VAEKSETVVPLSRRMSKMRVSAVREILKVTERPDILSFAGGLPAPELFPVEAINDAIARMLGKCGQAALQYSVTEGHAPLREWIAARLRSRGMRTGVDDLLITTGSQQGIDLVGKVLLDAGDVVAVENPSYLAALQVFNGYEVDLEVVGSDDDGMRVEELEALIARRRPKLIYLVTDFNNPKGTTLALARRKQLVDIAARNRIVILEDDPYGELRFRGTRPPSLAALDDQGVVMQLGTFSKTLAPGLRIGWICGPRALIRACTTAKQAADLHSATLTQRAAAELLIDFDYDAHLAKIRAVYGERCITMLDALERYLPRGSRWTKPDGGLFIWVQLPKGTRTEELLATAVEQQRVAFVPGKPFFAVDPQHECLRLNFSNQSSERIELGMKRLGAVLQRTREATVRV